MKGGSTSGGELREKYEEEEEMREAGEGFEGEYEGEFE